MGFGAVGGGMEDVDANAGADGNASALLPGLGAPARERADFGHHFFERRTAAQDRDDEMLRQKIADDGFRAAVVGAAHLRKDEAVEPVDAVVLKKMPGARRRGAFAAGV